MGAATFEETKYIFTMFDIKETDQNVFIIFSNIKFLKEKALEEKKLAAQKDEFQKTMTMKEKKLSVQKVQFNKKLASEEKNK